MIKFNIIRLLLNIKECVVRGKDDILRWGEVKIKEVYYKFVFRLECRYWDRI